MVQPLKIRVTLRVQPNASRSAVAGWYGDALRIRVVEPPTSGRANGAVVATLAEALGIARNAVAIVRGLGSRNKVAEVKGLDGEELQRRLRLAIECGGPSVPA